MIFPTEEQEQIALFDWTLLPPIMSKYPELKLLYHCPNGGKRNAREALKFKRMGVKAGVPDLFLPVARGAYHGLYIELKRANGRITKNQDDWLVELGRQGYKCVVCFGWSNASEVIEDYLQLQGGSQ